MKFSVPKNQTLLLEMQASEDNKKGNQQSVGDERRQNISLKEKLKVFDGKEKSSLKDGKQSSLGASKESFCMDLSKTKTSASNLKPHKEKKDEKYTTTADGYKSVKKMSLSNIEFNVSQDISKMPIKAKPLQFEGIKPKSIPGKAKKKLQWRDQDFRSPLVDIKLIPAENMGKKCSESRESLKRLMLSRTGKLD